VDAVTQPVVNAVAGGEDVAGGVDHASAATHGLLVGGEVVEPVPVVVEDPGRQTFSIHPVAGWTSAAARFSGVDTGCCTADEPFTVTPRATVTRTCRGTRTRK